MAEIWDKAYQANKHIGEMIADSDLKEKEVKHIPPNARMIFLAAQFDRVEMMLEITQDRLTEIFELLQVWLDREAASL